MFYSEGQGTFHGVSYSNRISRGTLEIVIQEVLWSIRGSYSAIWSLPLTNVKWHSDPWPTVTSQTIRLPPISWSWYRSWPSPHKEWFPWSIATDMACQQGTLTLLDTWFRPPFRDLLVLQLLRPDSSNLPFLNSTFHLEYPLVLSRFCFVIFLWPLCFG